MLSEKPLPGGFWIGVCEPGMARFFPRVCVSINRLAGRHRSFISHSWIMDSGAFSELTIHGCYRNGPDVYATQVKRWSRTRTLAAAVSQDFMCEPFVLRRTGLTVLEHQRMSCERYQFLLEQNLPVPIIPVLQGYEVGEYLAHLHMYGGLLTPGQWVGVGSVCKRNANPNSVKTILLEVKSRRPDLRLHGFGLKITALKDPVISRLLYSADSTAWRAAARREGRQAHSLEEARAYYRKVCGILGRDDDQIYSTALDKGRATARP